MLYVLSLPCGCAAAFLRRIWLRQQPCGSLRRPRRDRGIASSPYSLLGFSSHPFVPPPLRYGDGGGGAQRSYAALCLVAKGEGCCSAFFCFVAVIAAHPCAAFGCGSSRVAASGGQGGIGGLRVPPTPSLDSLLTPLYRRRSAVGMEAAGRRVLARRSAVVAKGCACCSAFFRRRAVIAAAFLRRFWLRQQPCGSLLYPFAPPLLR